MAANALPIQSPRLQSAVPQDSLNRLIVPQPTDHVFPRIGRIDADATTEAYGEALLVVPQRVSADRTPRVFWLYTAQKKHHHTQRERQEERSAECGGRADPTILARPRPSLFGPQTFAALSLRSGECQKPI